MAKYTITLDDGTKVYANLNMNTWESDVEPNDALFEDNTNNVSYTTPDGKTVKLGECKYVRGAHIGEIYMFFLKPITEAEKKERAVAQQIADVEDALCELAELMNL